ncbi:MAG: PH domain-containing protein [Pyrinomonadaceae bacterium]
MPATAMRFGVRNIFEPRDNIEGGAKYMRFLLDTFDGNVSLALAGYNAGEGAVMKYGRRVPPYRETQEYVRRIAQRYAVLRDPFAARSAKRVSNEQLASLRAEPAVSASEYEQQVFAVRLPNGRLRISKAVVAARTPAKRIIRKRADGDLNLCPPFRLPRGLAHLLVCYHRGSFLAAGETCMRCQNCREEVREGSSYCGSCGAVVIKDNEETHVARSNIAPSPPMRQPTREAAESERVIFKTRPTLLFIIIGYSICALLSIVVMIILARLGVSAPISLLVALFFLLFPAYYHIRRNAQRYTLTDSRVEIDRGVLVRTTRNVPLHKIQDVTVSASVLKRLIGVGDLIIENASDLGGATVLRNIHGPRRHADLLLRELRRGHQ